jgi:hypothetical protein
MIPFTGLKGIPFLGELAGEGHLTPTFVCVGIGFIYFFYDLPKLRKGYVFLLLPFFVSATISLFSIYNITAQDVFKGSTGEGRLFTQSFVLLLYSLFSCSVFLYLNRVGREKVLYIITYSTWWSFLVVIAFALIEAPYVLGLDFTKPFLDLYSAFFRADEYYDYLRRMRSISYEAPSLAMFLPLPLIVVYTLGNSGFKKKFFSFSMVVIIIILTFSRTAIVVFFVLLITYLYFYSIKQNMVNRFFIYLNCVFFLGFIIAVDSLFEMGITSQILEKVMSMAIDTSDEYHLASNLGRWGAQVAALNIGLDNLLLGVGLGQSGFHLPSYYPDWAFGSFQVRNWASPIDPLWPPVFSFYVRVFSELGVIAVGLLLYFIIQTLIWLRRSFIINTESRDEILFMLLSLVYCAVIFGQFASFRFVFFWVLLAILINYFESLNEKN